jgi:asparagine synthase (glutamine-hydrolysing)
MCGIFALLNNKNTIDGKLISQEFNKGKPRGPEYTSLQNLDYDTLFGFHRLAINGLNNESNQPIYVNNCYLICNGEIYNYKELYQEMNITPQTDSDCEVIIHLYNKYGIDQTLRLLDGVFSFILLDKRHDVFKMYVSRDPYGVRPLYALYPKSIFSSQEFEHKKEPIICFASELKMLSKFYSTMNHKEWQIKQFLPGTYSLLKRSDFFDNNWGFTSFETGYSTPGYSIIKNTSTNMILKEIYNKLCMAVKKRVDNTERPIACLLSGGLDSSLITGMVKKYYTGTLETYSIGLEGAEDLKYAASVAKHLNTKHTEIIMTEKDFFDAIPETIYAIESYDTTTIRASVGNYLIGKYIRENSEAKVIFNGDGADEIMGGYMYMHKCPDKIEFDSECRRLLRDIHMYDVQRSDRSIASNGLEPRTPFLDREFVQYYFSIPKHIRFHPENKNCEKYLLRKAIQDNDPELIPNEIIWRKKEAFSDGVSNMNKSWYTIIDTQLKDKTFTPVSNIYECHLDMTTNEKKYYYTLFAEKFPNLAYIIEYYWMPKYINANDASARTLDIYQEILPKASCVNETI